MSFCTILPPRLDQVPSYLALYGERDPVESLRLTQQTADVTRTDSNAVTGLAQLHLAEAHAMLGDARRCESALAAAECSLSNIDATDDTVHLLSETQFDRLAGSCYLFLGEHRHAESILTATAQAMTVPSKSRAIVLGTSVSLTCTSVTSMRLPRACTTRSMSWRPPGVVAGWNVVSEAVRKLRRWRSEPAVQDIYDRILILMAKA